MRLLELQATAGLASNFLESVSDAIPKDRHSLNKASQIEGLETIRAFGWSDIIRRSNIQRTDDARRPEYLLMCLQMWLNVMLDLLAAAVATGVVAVAVLLRGRVSGGRVGVALNTMLVVNATLLKLVESWTTMENSMGAISRIKTIEDMVPSEGRQVRALDTPANWPPKGRVKVKNISASYK